MNIGTQTNSLVNHLYSRMTVNAPAPTVSMAATTLMWSDRHAATVTSVTEVKSRLWAYEITVVDDTVTVISGSTHDGSAKFATAPNPDGHADLYRMDRKTGEWSHGYRNSVNRFCVSPGRLILGKRDHYVDPSF